MSSPQAKPHSEAMHTAEPDPTTPSLCRLSAYGFFPVVPCHRQPWTRAGSASVSAAPAALTVYLTWVLYKQQNPQLIVLS